MGGECSMNAVADESVKVVSRRARGKETTGKSKT
jgi:hypothetical protein